MKNATRSTKAPKTTILTSGNRGFGYVDHGDGTATMASGEWGCKGSKPAQVTLEAAEQHASDLRAAGWR